MPSPCKFDNLLTFCLTKSFKTMVKVGVGILDSIATQHRFTINCLYLDEWHPDVAELTNLEQLVLYLKFEDIHLVRVLCTRTLLPKVKTIVLYDYFYQKGSRTTFEKLIRIRGHQLKHIELNVLSHAKQLVHLLANSNLILEYLKIVFIDRSDYNLTVDEVRSLLRISVREPLVIQSITYWEQLLAEAVETEPNKKSRIVLH